VREVEVTEKARRRRFTAEYKQRILEEAAACAKAERGALGALLRREGLYSSHLVEWRRAAAEGQAEALERKRGPKSKVDPRDREIARLRHEVAEQARQLEQAHAIIDVKKKLSRLLGITLPKLPGSDDEESP
jgi:transposase-like protein